MTGHTSEEKIKILYEDSLREIRELSDRIAAVSNVVADAADKFERQGKILRGDNERLLLDTVDKLKASVSEVIGVQEGLNKTAAKVVVELLTGKDGPLVKLNNLVKQQQEALGWINRATEFYTRSIYPIFFASLFGGLVGGIATTLIWKVAP